MAPSAPPDRLRRRTPPTGSSAHHQGTYPEQYAASSSKPDADPAAPPDPPATDSTFECNVCFDTPADPVVTPCGHLYCWSCLYRWMRLHADSPQCPVCKAAVDKRSVIPIYGRGLTEHRDPREHGVPEEDVPPRPQGHRAQPAAQPMHHGPYGLHPMWRGINPYGANYDNVSLSTFGLFPSLFGLQIAYPHVNEPARDEPPANQEDGMSELVAKVFLLIMLFIVIIITTF